ncbi:tigger transposable element-derived protein 1-like [Hermetia illucens]|uniref:tigger transposable element-derived protein 1-like n=1 Tax=Hermetia illucens TaxID=343691 RepID=UPI0018CC1C41|nr:tigger transposable element-derived protein 1-like [Hermetia illucens]
MEIIKCLDEGERTAQIAVSLGLKACAIRQIKRNAEKIREHIKAGISSPGSTKIAKHRPFVLEKTEKLLYTWILYMNQRNIPISTAVIQENQAFEFNASRGWFGKLKSRFGLHNLKLAGEAASAGYEEVNKFPDMLKSIVDEGGYSSRQVFNIDETGLYWKRLTSVSKDWLTLVLGGNAAGDFKRKPLLTENLRALKMLSKTTLPAIWRHNKKGNFVAQSFAISR